MVKMSFGYLAQRLKDTFDVYKYENIHSDKNGNKGIQSIKIC